MRKSTDITELGKIKIGSINNTIIRETMLNKNIGIVDYTYKNIVPTDLLFAKTYNKLLTEIEDITSTIFNRPNLLSYTDDTKIGVIGENLREVTNRDTTNYNYINSYIKTNNTNSDIKTNEPAYTPNYENIMFIGSYIKLNDGDKNTIKKGISYIPDYKVYDNKKSIEDVISEEVKGINFNPPSIYYDGVFNTIDTNGSSLYSPISNFTKVIRKTYIDKYAFNSDDNRRYDNNNQYSSGSANTIRNITYVDNNIYTADYVFPFTSNEKDLKNSLLYKTNELFNSNENNNYTIINEEYLNINEIILDNLGDRISRGKNLLNDESDQTSYLRVWTKLKQYNTVKKSIKPFKDNNGDVLTIRDLQKEWGNSDSKSYNRGRSSDGVNKLIDNTVIGNNGYVRISPTVDNPNIKNCMFSIENLAWKDARGDKYLSGEQIGSNGGRIMWFPPYNIKFTENISVNWNQQAFIGRGEQVYTYSNTDRGGTLDFSILVDYPSIIDYWKINKTETTENDLLKFFAGVIPDETNVKNEVTSTIDVPPQNTPNSSTVPNKHKKINIYFPNNYSGIDSIDNPDDAAYAEMGFREIDAFEYLFWGVDAQTIEEIGPWRDNYNGCRGYEMRDNLLRSETDEYQGISTYNGAGGIMNGTTPNKTKYYYRVDKSTLSQISKSDILIDSNSNKLNSSINSTDEVSFAEFYLALDILKNNTEDYYDTDKFIFLTKHCFADSAKTIDNIDFIKGLLGGKKEYIKSIKITPSASKSGNDNKILKENRAKSVKNFITTHVSGLGDKISIQPGFDGNGTTINGPDSKVSRSVKIEIEYNDSIITKTSPTNIIYVNTNPTIDSITIKNPNTYDGVRYDDEYKFFETINTNDKINRALLTEKIKYFDPAFHSISPEGFNSRLTFIHQCTRQGDTKELGGGDTSTAANLAFGRPPVCVLKIGDFYNTRIIIEAVTINYDPSTWDFNHEGIGMQPMMANISMTFKFIGGSDLTGPINRLQNAVSFNYYANTGVYDDRSDEKDIIISAKNDLSKNIGKK